MLILWQTVHFYYYSLHVNTNFLNVQMPYESSHKCEWQKFTTQCVVHTHTRSLIVMYVEHVFMRIKQYQIESSRFRFDYLCHYGNQ